MSSHYWCCLRKFASAADMNTCKVTPEWCSNHLVGKVRILLFANRKSQIQKMVTHCMFLSVTQKLNGLVGGVGVFYLFVLLFFFFKGTSFLIIARFGKSLSRKYCSFFSRAHIKTQLIATTLPVIAIWFPNKTTISIHLPSLVTAKQTAYYCEGQENLVKFTSEAHHHFLISTESTSSFPLQPRTEMQQWSQTSDSDGSPVWNAGVQTESSPYQPLLLRFKCSVN